MSRILESLKTRLGAGQRGGDIPETLRAEPSDIVFYALQEPRKAPALPTRPMPMIRDQPPSPFGGIPEPMQAQPPMMQPQQEPMMQSQPARPEQPPGADMDLSSLFEF